jgi:hypothetical protein
MKVTIKAAFADCIRMYKHRKNELKNLGFKIKRIEKDLPSMQKDELIKLLNSVDVYLIENDLFIYNRLLTKKEIEKQTKDLKNGIDYDIYRLKKWCNLSEYNKNQILIYLYHIDLKIEGIN